MADRNEDDGKQQKIEEVKFLVAGNNKDNE